MPRALILFVMIGLMGGPLHAGAWPRGEGNQFFASSMRIAGSDIVGPFSTYSTFYYEYGWNDQLTVGVDIGRAVSGEIKAIVYGRWPIFTRSTNNRFAFEIGAGSIAGQTMVRPGLSFGRGIKTRWGHGWVAMESLAEINTTSGNADLKADFTLGINLRPKIKILLQLQTGAPATDPYFVRFAPSVVVKVAPKLQFEIGLTSGVVGDDQVGIKFGLWRDF